jgi:hypothetical protein
MTPYGNEMLVLAVALAAFVEYQISGIGFARNTRGNVVLPSAEISSISPVLAIATISVAAQLGSGQPTDPPRQP